MFLKIIIQKHAFKSVIEHLPSSTVSLHIVQQSYTTVRQGVLSAVEVRNVLRALTWPVNCLFVSRAVRVSTLAVRSHQAAALKHMHNSSAEIRHVWTAQRHLK